VEGPIRGTISATTDDCATKHDVVKHECGKGWRRDLTELGVRIEQWRGKNPGKCSIDYARAHGGVGSYY
jgi:hypothetical protein